jgi:hypothetical protein
MGSICRFMFFALMYVIRLKLPPPAGSTLNPRFRNYRPPKHEMIVIVIDQTLPITCKPVSAQSSFLDPFSFIVAHYKVYNRFNHHVLLPSISREQEELSTAFQNHKSRSFVRSYVCAACVHTSFKWVSPI